MRGLNVQITVSVGAADHRTHADGAIAGRRASDLTAGIVPARSDRSGGSEPSTSDLLVRVADQAMYAAKASGKGRVVLAEEAPTKTG